MAVFVWYLDFARRPWPQKWPELRFGIDGAKRSLVAFHRELTPDERDLSLDQLAEKYPAPPTQESE